MIINGNTTRRRARWTHHQCSRGRVARHVVVHARAGAVTRGLDRLGRHRRRTEMRTDRRVAVIAESHPTLHRRHRIEATAVVVAVLVHAPRLRATRAPRVTRHHVTRRDATRPTAAVATVVVVVAAGPPMVVATTTRASTAYVTIRPRTKCSPCSVWIETARRPTSWSCSRSTVPLIAKWS